jgi:hypothetical protein
MPFPILMETCRRICGPREGGVARGKSEFLTMIRKIVDGPTKVTSINHTHRLKIEIQSPNEATGVWVLEDPFWWMS